MTGWYFFMAGLFNQLKAEILFHRAVQILGEHEKALDLLERARSLNPGSHGIVLQLGNLRLLAGDLAGALSDLQEAENLDPESSVSPQYQGIIHLLRKDIDSAAACFSRALARSPQNQLNRNYQALCTIQKGNVAAGIGELKKEGIYSNPRFVGLLMTTLEELAGHSCGSIPPPGTEAGSADEADETAQIPVTDDSPGAVQQEPFLVRLLVFPFCAVFYWFLGHHYLNRSRFPQAAGCFRKVFHYAPSTQRIHFHLGEALFYDKAYDEALTQFSLSFKADGDNPEVLYYLGRLFQMKGDLGQARQYFTESLEKFQKSPETLLALGQIALAEGDSIRACQSFTLAAEYDFIFIMERIEEMEKELVP